MDSQTHQKIKEHLSKSQQVGIVVNKNPNLDSMAAALGLYLSLKQSGKSVAVASPTDPIVGISNLVGIDKVKKSLASDGGDLTVSFPYRDGEIEKVSYTIEDGHLNIVVKAAEKGLLFEEKEVIFKRGGKPMHLIFFIGVPSLADVQGVIDEAHKDAVTINIDNKPMNQQYGDITVVSPNFSSLSEQIADFLTLPESEMYLDTDIAQNLLSGITYATNDFQNPNTSHLAFEMAGILMRKGAVRKRKAVVAEDHKQSSAFIPQPRPQTQQQQPRPQQQQQSQQHQLQTMNQNQSRPQPSQFRPTQQNPQVQNVPQSQPVQQNSQPQIVQQSQPMQQNQNSQPQQQRQSQPESQPQPQQQPQQSSDTPPADWLQPKVYKGSSFS